MSITTPVPLPVMVLDPRRRGEREAVIERLSRYARCVDVRLTLDDGAVAEACMDADEAAWLELREGDIVPVAVLPQPASAPQAGVVGLREVGHALG
jgi:hypothetical protein